jgi:tetratricopeptide (TPR) repeat protein
MALAELNRTHGIERLELAAFGAKELTAQLHNLLGDAPSPTTVESILARSGGNAFFAEELLAAGMGAEGMQLPPKLRDVIMTRTEALSEEALDVLRVIAVAGRLVSHRLIAAASQLPERTLLLALREAVAHHFLVGDPGQGTYSFRHALAQEAIYADLLPGELIRLHAAIARTLTEDPSLAGGQPAMVAAELAHHWHAAGSHLRALTASVEAGRSASRIFAFAEAQPQLERALELWSLVPDAETKAGLTHGQLLEEASDAALWAGDVDRAVEHVHEALAGVDSDREPLRTGVLKDRLGRYLWRRGDSEGSIAAHAEAVRLLAGLGPSPERAQALAAYGTVLLIAGRYHEARVWSEQAVAIAKTMRARQAEGYSLNTLGVSLTMLGDPDRGISALLKARSIAEEMQGFHDLYRAYTNLSVVLETAGRLDEAANVALQGLAMARQFSVELAAGPTLILNAASQLFLLGRWEEEEQLIRKAPGLEANPRFGPYLSLARGELAMALGRFDQAQEHLETARRALSHLADPLFLGPLFACLAELAIWRRDLTAAQEAVEDGLQRMASSEDEQLKIRLCALGIRAQADEAEDATAALATARVDAAQSIGAMLLAEVRARFGGSVRSQVLPEANAMTQLCEAEYARLEGGQSRSCGRRPQGFGTSSMNRTEPRTHNGVGCKRTYVEDHRQLGQHCSSERMRRHCSFAPSRSGISSSF